MLQEMQIPIEKSLKAENLQKTKELLNHYRLLVLEIQEDFEVVRGNYGLFDSLDDIINFSKSNDFTTKSNVNISSSLRHRIEKIAETKKYLNEFLSAVEKLKEIKYMISESATQINLNKGNIYYLLIKMRYLESDGSKIGKGEIIGGINNKLNLHLAESSYTRIHIAAVNALSDLLWFGNVKKIENIFEEMKAS